MRDEYLFISDCHLDAGKPEVSAALTRFLSERATLARHLYILGDLFEVWLGDDDPATDLHEVIDSLRELAHNTRVFFMAGNRDFLLGKEFASQVGITLLEEPQLLELGDNQVALIHGDSLCTDDHDYQAFRSLVRTPQWKSEFLNKPLAERQRIAAQLRIDSTDAMAEKSMEIMDVNAQAVQNCFHEHGVDTIVHGHTHRPAVHHYASNLTRYVLGDWNPEASYLTWNASQGFKLIDPRV